MGSVNKTAGGIGTLALDATNNALDAAMSEFDSEVRVKVSVDTSELDNWVNNELGSIRPYTSFVNRMADASRPNHNQNGSNLSRNDDDNRRNDEIKQPIEYHAHLHALGSLPKSTIDRMAKDFEESLKRMEDSSKMGRGEPVMF